MIFERHLLDALQLTPLPFRPEHVDEIRDLGTHHGDPFDRALIAVAIAEELSLLTADKGIKASTQSHEPSLMWLQHRRRPGGASVFEFSDLPERGMRALRASVPPAPSPSASGNLRSA